MRNQRKIGASIDWITIGLYMTLVLMGWLFIYSARYDEVHEQGIFQISGEDGDSFGYEAGKQFLWIMLSFALIIAILVIDFKFYFSSAYIIFGVAMFTFVAVLLFGKEVNGAKSWFDLGFVRLQPAEFGKFATGLALARYLSTKSPNYSFSFKDYCTAIAKFFGMTTQVVRLRVLWVELMAAGIILLPAVLIVLQGDAGSALVYGGFIIVLYADGLPSFVPSTILMSIGFFVLSLLFPSPYLFVAIGVGCVLLFLILHKSIENIVGLIIGALFFSGVVIGSKYFVNDVLKPHQRTRITVLTGEEDRLKEQILEWKGYIVAAKDSNKTVEARELKVELDSIRQCLYDLRGGAAYNINNSEMAISYGGTWGQGYMEGILTKGDHVPEQHTDFIFSTIGEEMGFFGSFIIVALFMALLMRLIFLAERQKSHFARVYGYSVAAIIFMHFLINIAMTIRLFPVIGIPLPFFSYGGSSLWSFTILLFIFLKLDMHRGQVLAR